MENPQVVAGAASREIVFVENNIDDWQALVDALVPGTEVVVLDSRSNGLQQMADHLAGRSGIDAIHVFSHGAGGRIDLGASALSAATLAPNAGLLGDIGRALGDGGDFLVYGCELAKDDAGRALIASVARLLQADVAASVDATTPGSLALEYATGSISADPAQLFDSAKLAAGKWVLSAPAIANLDGESVALAAAGSSVKLDAGTALAISDAEFSGDWDGATLTVQRSGTAIGNDVFGFDTSANPGFTVGAGVLQAGGQTFATFTNSGGVLSIDFSGSGTTATKALVEKVMQNVTYRNDTPYGDATIRFALSDGTDTATADVTVTSSRIYVDQSAYDTDGDIADGFNLAEALAAAGDGDTILIKDGTYRGQFVATKAVTIDAANGAAGNVILESPDRADLQFSSRQTIHGRERIPILDLRTSTAGQGTVTVKNLTVDGRNQAPSDTQYPTITVPRTNGLMHQIGIATFDTNALIDNVKVKNISTTVDPVSGDYSGLSENFGMLAEGRAELAAKVSVTIRNSTITTFQKAGINAWGPKLDVNILDNTITGVGVHGTSNQNGIQIGSLSPRTGTTGVVSGNTISGLDTNDNNWGATGLLLFESGAVEIKDNIFSADRDGSLNHMVAVDVATSASGISIHGNSFGKANTAVQIEGSGTPAIGANDFRNAYITVLDDVDAGAANALDINVNSTGTVSNGRGALYYQLNGGHDKFTDLGSSPSLIEGGAGNDSITAGSGGDTLKGGTGNDSLKAGAGGDTLEGGAGNDTLDGGAGSDVYQYAATGNEVDLLASLSVDDVIRVTGRASTNGTITTGDGSNVAANSIQVSAGGGITYLYIDTDGSAGAAELEIRVDGSYAASDFVISGTDIRRAPPVVDDGPSTPAKTNTTIDGVKVETSTTPDATTGVPSNVIVVPVVTSTRQEDTSTQHGTLADIPVGVTEGNTKVELVVSLPVGTGLRAEGPSTLLSNQQAILDLIKRIESKTEPASETQKAMKTEGQSFLDGLAPDTKLVTRTLVLTHEQSAPAIQDPIVITGSSFSGGATNTSVGLVIDARSLPPGTLLRLDSVDFASVVGATVVRGGEGKNYVVGDDAAQDIMLGADDDELHGGGGNDKVGSAAGNDRIFGDDGDDALFGGAGQDLVCGGRGTDTVTYGQNRADYAIERNGKIVTVRSLKDATDADTLVNVEKISFGDGTLTVSDDGAPAALPELVAGLYAAFYKRAPDNAGLQYWIEQANAGQLSLRDMADRFAGIAKFGELYPDSLSTEAFVAKIYQNILGIQGDQAGREFWATMIDSGVSRTQFVADFVTSALNFDAGSTTVTGTDLANANMAKNTLSNKVEVGLHFAATLAAKSNGGVDSDPYKQSVEVLAGVSDNSQSVEDAVVRIDLIGGHTGYGSAVPVQGIFL